MPPSDDATRNLARLLVAQRLAKDEYATLLAAQTTAPTPSTLAPALTRYYEASARYDAALEGIVNSRRAS